MPDSIELFDCRAYQIECAPRLLGAMFVINRELLGGLDRGFERSLRFFEEHRRFVSWRERPAQLVPERNRTRVVKFPLGKLSQFPLGESLDGAG